jgi:hypothetical protein
MKGTGASANHYRRQNIHQSLFLHFSSAMHHT